MAVRIGGKLVFNFGRTHDLIWKFIKNSLKERGESLAKFLWKQWYGFLALGSPATSASRRALSKMSCKILPRHFKIWQEICSKSMPTFGTCKNLSYLARFLFQIHAKMLYCLIYCQILARSWQDFFIGDSKIDRSSLLIHTIAIPKERLYWHEI